MRNGFCKKVINDQFKQTIEQQILEMDIDDEQKFLQTVALVLQDIQCFLSEKVNHNLIQAMLCIKKAARKNNRTLQQQSMQKRSSASLSQKSHSEKRSSVSPHSVAKSIDKSSHASFDIVKGAQNFNSIKYKGIQQKIYTETYQNQQQCLSNYEKQPRRFSNPPQFEQPQQNVNIVPKLVGLVSSDQISDIEQPHPTDERNEKRVIIKNYENSIAEVDDDDDEFQDIVLSRLDKIQQKVNQMLRQKESQRVRTISSQGNPPPYRMPRTRLQNVGSGPNIIYSHQQRHPQMLNYQKQRHHTSTALVSPRVYTFQNSKNTSGFASSKKGSNANTKLNLTQRISNPSKFVNLPNYLTDHQQNPLEENVRRQKISDLNTDFYENQSFQNGKNTIENHRESLKTFVQNNQKDPLQEQSEQKNLKNVESPIDYQKIKEKALDGSQAFKYIPLNKMGLNKPQITPQKTERHVSRKPNQTLIERKQKPTSYMGNRSTDFLVQNTLQMKQPRISEQNHSRRYVQVRDYRRNDPKEDEKYLSGRDSGVRGKQLQNSGMKAYTENGDFIQSGDQLSVSSEKNIYSEIRQLRQMTKLYGAQRQRKQGLMQQRPYRVAQQNHIPVDYQNMDYRYHQKTQRPKYSTSSRQKSNQQQFDEQHVIIQGRYPQERVVRVVRQSPVYYQQAPVVPVRRMGQNVEYVEYSRHGPIIYDQHQSNPAYQRPVYVVRERPGSRCDTNEEVFQDVSYIPTNDYRSVIINDGLNSTSHRKLSSGSINSFKSIPYERLQVNRNPSSREFVQGKYVVEKSAQYIKKSNKSQY